MDGSTQVQIVTIICSTILAALTLWLRYDVNGLKPHVMSVSEQLAEANKFILQQGTMLKDLRDEINMRKPTMTEKRFDEDFKASPPYKKPDK